MINENPTKRMVDKRHGEQKGKWYDKRRDGATEA